MDTGITSHK